MGLTPRVGSWSRVNFLEEVTPGSDVGISAAFKAPLSGPSSVIPSQGLVSVPVYKGDRRPHSKVLGPITAAGKLPLNLEFLFFLRIIVVLLGRAGYSRPLGGSSSLHRILIPTTDGSIPGTFQLENVFLQATKVIQRLRYLMGSAINFNLGTSGPALYDIDTVGIGDVVNSAAELFAPSDDGLVPTTYYNGQVNFGSQIGIADLNALTLSLMFNVQRVEAFANGGVAAGLVSGNVEPKGSIRLVHTITGSNPGADLNAWNQATQGTEVPIECFVTDQPVAGANGGVVFPSKYIRFLMPTCRMGAAGPAPGGMGPSFIQQPFEAARSNSQGTAAASVAGEVWSTNGGPYNVPASAALGVKIDGGGTIGGASGIPITTGATRTAAQICADLNGNGPFAAVATADVFMGNRVRIRSKQTSTNIGALSSVQIDTATTNSCHVLLGFTGTAVSGVTNCELYMEIWNGLGSDI